MYTNTIIGSYNAIANSEHHAMIMKPPIKRQPKKANSKDIPTPSQTRGNSEDSPIGMPPPTTNIIINPFPSIPSHTPPTTVEGLPVLPGLEILASLDSLEVHPDKTCSPEVAKISFTIDGPDGTPLLKCLPTENTNTRSLMFQTIEGVHVLDVKTPTPYCCSWFKNHEAKIDLPNGSKFGTINKTAFGPCMFYRKFMMTFYKTEAEKIQFEVEVVLSPAEFLIKKDDVVLAKVSTKRIELKTLYTVSFMKPSELSPNFKALFAIFAIILHIAFAEKLNTCLGMCLCCCAGSAVAAWALCLL